MILVLAFGTVFSLRKVRESNACFAKFSAFISFAEQQMQPYQSVSAYRGTYDNFLNADLQCSSITYLEAFYVKRKGDGRSSQYAKGDLEAKRKPISAR